MKRIKFRLSTILLALALFAVSLAWLLERQQFAVAIQGEREREGDLRAAIEKAESALKIHQGYMTQEAWKTERLRGISPAGSGRRRDISFMEVIGELYKNKEKAASRRVPLLSEKTFSREEYIEELAASCCWLIKTSTTEDFESLFLFYSTQQGFPEHLKSEHFLSTPRNLAVDFRAFIERAISRNQVVAEMIGTHRQSKQESQHDGQAYLLPAPP